MKKRISVFLFLLSLFIFTACKGSTDIQGEWYATGIYTQSGVSQNYYVKILIDEKKIKMIQENEGELAKIAEESIQEDVGYKQTGTGFQNSVSYKLIQAGNIKYSFVFPEKKDKENAILMIPESSDEALQGTILFKLSKEDYPEFEHP